MPELKVIDHAAVLAAVSPRDAIERVRDGFIAYARGEWAMPAKVYLTAPPAGDFRAMPARGNGLAIVKWVTSFPDNPAHGRPTVTGLIVVSDASNGEPLALIDGRAVTALRTGAVAPVATEAVRGATRGSVAIVGCGLHGAWVARCMAAAGYGPGVCHDPQPAAAEALAGELGWQAGERAAAAACDTVCTITPGAAPVIAESDLRAGQHFNALGADGPGKAELEPAALARCTLYCDEWSQAAHGGELTAAAESGAITRGDVTEIGALLTGEADRPAADAITLFDSTGLAIQDLAICAHLMQLLADGGVTASTVNV